ncbi:MAG: hypothetical protein N3D17_05865 [bacterium]|nr:hypothetical protein [bacterium]
MADKDKRFNVGDGGDIDRNIQKLQRELDEMLMKGAPKIKKSDSDEEVKRIKLEEEEREEVKSPVVQESRYTSVYNKPAESSDGISLFRNRKFYIIVFGIVAFGFTLIKAPVFRYTTPARHDNDLPEIEIGFRYYNNIFGQQTKNETVVYIGQEKIVIPISMERWYNLEKEKKLIAIEYYRKK